MMNESSQMIGQPLDRTDGPLKVTGRVAQGDRAASPDIGGDGADRVLARFCQHRDGRADLTGCAIPALEAVVLDERRLHGMESGRIRKSLDGLDAIAVVRYRERQARVDATVVDEHRACTALSAIAPAPALHAS